MVTSDIAYQSGRHIQIAKPPTNLYRLLKMIWQSRLFILLFGATFAAVAFGVLLFVPKHYTSTAQILLDPEGTRIMEDDPEGQPRSVESHVANQQYILSSNSVLSRVVESERLADDARFGAKEPYYEDKKSRTKLALDNLRNSLFVAAAAKSFVINVSVAADNPQRAAHLANVVASTYLQVRTEMNSSVLSRTGQSLSERLHQLRQAVEDGDKAVQDYRAENHLVDVLGRPEIEQRIAEANTEISKLTAAITDRSAMIAQVSRARTDKQFLRFIPDASLTPAIISLRARYQESIEGESVQAASLGTQHPMIQAARARIQSLSDILDEQLRNFLESSARDLERLKAQLVLLQKNASSLKRSLSGDQQAMVALRELQRKLDSDRSVYEAFLLRTTQLSEQKNTSGENPRIISPAQPQLRDTGLGRPIFIAGSGMFGLLLAAGIALFHGRPHNQDKPEK